MILADTSVWAGHFNRKGVGLAEWLSRGAVLMHPLVLGELACGNLPDRRRTLELLRGHPHATEATHEEVLALLESHRLMGTGLGIVDVALLSSARLSGARLWSLDQPLARAAARLDIAHDGSPPPPAASPD